MPTPQFVLSTVGTSLIDKCLNEDELIWRERLKKETNAKTLSRDLADKVAEIQGRALERLCDGDVQTRRRLSAELNGIYGVYQDQLSGARADMHWLIATDTALGHIVGELLQEFLTRQGVICQVYTPEGLSTGDRASFTKGMKNLLAWCEEHIPAQRAAGRRVVFNLTGAFKSLQGYLTIVGMFYADQVVYIFETSPELLSIPRLPLRVDTDALKPHRTAMAMMSQGHVCGAEQVVGIPDGLLETDEQGCAVLSEWGRLVWNQVEAEMLSQELLPFPRLEYEQSFRRDYERAQKVEKVDLHQTLADVAGRLERDSGSTKGLVGGGLRYGPLLSRKTPDGQTIDHFRTTRSFRVTCVAGDGKLRLRRFGDHDIEKNP